MSSSQKGHSSCLYESEKSENVSSCVLVPPKLLYTLFFYKNSECTLAEGQVFLRNFSEIEGEILLTYFLLIQT